MLNSIICHKTRSLR